MRKKIIEPSAACLQFFVSFMATAMVLDVNVEVRAELDVVNLSQSAGSHSTLPFLGALMYYFKGKRRNYG